MKGLWLEEQKLSLRNDLPMPVLEPGEALIKPALSGICSTDLEMVKGYYPFTGVPGHEFVGYVTEAPSAPQWVGKRVVGTISVSCGRCRQCLTGRRGHCEHRRTLGIYNYPGVFAEYTKLPLENLHEVPASVSDEEAVFTEPLAAALEILEQVEIRPEDKVVVVGAGRLGLLIAQVLKHTGAGLQVVVRREEPAKILAGWGIRSAYATDIKPASADLVVEVTGSEAGFEVSRRLLRPAGTLVLKSTFAGNISLNLSSIVVDEIKLIGSRCGPFDKAIDLLERKAIDLKPLIHASLPLEEGLQAFGLAAKAGVLKVLIRP